MKPTKKPPPHLTIRPGEIGRCLLLALQRFHHAGHFIDVRIMRHGKVLAVGHKVIFAAFSRYFEQLLADAEGIAVLNVNSIDEQHVAYIPSIVDFMYGRVVVAHDGVREARGVLAAARFLGVSSLVKYIGLLDLSSCPRPDEPLALTPTAASELLLVALQRFRAARLFFDAKILFPDEIALRAHKIVLASASSYLETLLLSEAVDQCSALGLDQIEDEYLKLMPKLFDYLYGITVKIDAAHVPYFLDTARVFGIDTLSLHELVRLRDRAARVDQQRMLARNRQSAQTDTGSEKERSSKSPFTSLLTRVDADRLRDAWRRCPLQPVDDRDVESVRRSNRRHHPRDANGEMIIEGRDERQRHAQGNPLEPLSIDGELPSSLNRGLLSPTTSSSLFGDERLMESLLPEMGDAILVAQDQIVDVYEEVHGGSEAQALTNAEEVETNTPELPDASVSSSPTSSRRTRAQTNEKHAARRATRSAHTRPSVSANVSVGEAICFICEVCGCALESATEMCLHKHNAHDFDVLRNASAITTKRDRKGAFVAPNMQKMARNAAIKVSAHRTRSFASSSIPASSYNCDLCDYIGTSRAYLNEHRKGKHGLLSNGCRVQLIACEMCDERFVYRSLLRKHVKSVHDHNKQRHFPCMQCEYAAFDKRGLETHVRIVHARERPFSCPYCLDTFATSSHLYRHVRARHEHLITDAQRNVNANANHRCLQCGQIFKEKRELTVHVNRDHNDVRPFPCDRCEKGFFRRDHLRVHQTRVHLKSPRKGLRCD